MATTPSNDPSPALRGPARPFVGRSDGAAGSGTGALPAATRTIGRGIARPFVPPGLATAEVASVASEGGAAAGAAAATPPALPEANRAPAAAGNGAGGTPAVAAPGAVADPEEVTAPAAATGQGTASLRDGSATDDDARDEALIEADENWPTGALTEGESVIVEELAGAELDLPGVVPGADNAEPHAEHDGSHGGADHPGTVAHLATGERAEVVPPAEAWPDDVWPDDAPIESAWAGGAGDALGGVAEPAGTQRGDFAAEAPFDPFETGATAYLPSVPDTTQAYATDGGGELAAPSAVYLPDTAESWRDSGGIRPGASAGAELASSSARTDAARDLATRLDMLAARLRAGELTPTGYRDDMRDAAALVALLGAVLEAER